MSEEHFLYLLNVETGEKAERTDISEMRPAEVIAAEARLWSLCQEDGPWVVRDSRNDS
jgi:hypothetical protein